MKIKWNNYWFGCQKDLVEFYILHIIEKLTFDTTTIIKNIVYNAHSF